jgi:hypothetical protein
MKSVRDMVGEARAQIEQMEPQDVADVLASGEANIVDVREPVE